MLDETTRARHVEAVRRDGFTIVENAIEADLVEALSAALVAPAAAALGWLHPAAAIETAATMTRVDRFIVDLFERSTLQPAR